MAPGQIIVASVAGAAGVKAAPYARAIVPLANENMKTLAVVGGGVAVAAGGVMLHNKANGAGYAGPALVGFGLGVALGAACDHFGF